MRQFVKNLSSLLYISGRVWFCLKNGLIWRVTFILWLKKLIKHILSNTNDKKRKGKNQNILVIMIIMLAIAVACGRWQVLIRKVVCLILKKKKKVSASLTFQKSSSRFMIIITSTCNNAWRFDPTINNQIHQKHFWKAASERQHCKWSEETRLIPHVKWNIMKMKLWAYTETSHTNNYMQTE